MSALATNGREGRRRATEVGGGACAVGEVEAVRREGLGLHKEEEAGERDESKHRLDLLSDTWIK